MRIKDNVHNVIEFSAFEQRIIDSESFQRLRRIKQIAFTYLVYPGATHTRFEHSLGTAYLAGEIALRLGLDADTRAKVRLAGLLHDIGHSAFSHDGERVLEKRLGSHEKIGKDLLQESGLKDIIQENFRVREILELDKRPEGQIVSSDLGADRMDYLLRDARATGVAYGVVDIDRIIHTLRLRGRDLCIDTGGLEAAESLLIARFMMFSTVYLHHTVRIASAMLRRAMVLALEEKTVQAEEFIRCSDEEMLSRMQAGSARPWVDGILQRKLYKELHSFQPSAHPTLSEKELSKKYACTILVDPPYAFFKSIGIQVTYEGALRPLVELSPLVKTLEQSEENRKRTLILCPPEKRDELKKQFRV